MKPLSAVKGFIGMTIAVPLAGMAMGAVGSAASIPSGIGSATQTLIGGGLLGHASKLFNFK